jgi:hypothetical protein
LVSVVLLLDFDRGAHVELAVEALVVRPPHVFERREFDLLDSAPASPSPDELGLVEPVDGLSQGTLSKQSPTVPVEGVAPSSTILSV